MAMRPWHRPRAAVTSHSAAELDHVSEVRALAVIGFDAVMPMSYPVSAGSQIRYSRPLASTT